MERPLPLTPGQLARLVLPVERPVGRQGPRHPFIDFSSNVRRQLADLVPDYELSPEYILPKALDFRGAPEVAAAVARAAIETGEARRRVDPRLILENTRDYLYGGTLRALPGEPIGDQPGLPLEK